MGKDSGVGFGVAGSVLSLGALLLFILGVFSIIPSIFLIGAALLSLLSLVFSIVQMTKKKTRLSVVGLVLGVVVFASFALFLFNVVNSSYYYHYNTYCLDAMTSLKIDSVCGDGQNVYAILDFKQVNDIEIEKVVFIAIDSPEGRSNYGNYFAEKSMKEGEYVISYSELGIDSVYELGVAPVVMFGGAQEACDISDTRIVEDC